MNHHEPTLVPKKELPAGVVRTGWILTALGAALAALSYLTDGHRAAFNHLIGFTFLASVGVGGLFLVALEYIAGAVWSTPFRRLSEFLAGLLPVTLLLGVPLVPQLHTLFHWSHADAVAADPILQAKAPYLNETFFVVRLAVIFGLWILFAWLFRRNSMKQDADRDQKRTTTNIKLAAAFIPLFAVTVSVFSMDWLMSLEPHWFSTIFGIYYFTGTAICALAVVTFAMVSLSEKGYFFAGVREDHYYSFGALLFGLLSFWAYIAFSQFMLIWYANLPEENFWFIARWQNGWEWVSIALVVFHFWLPYFMLVSRPSKMNTGNLKRSAAMLAAVHFLDLYWLAMPTYSKSPVFGFHELAFPLLAAGIIIVGLAVQMKRHNSVPVGDPKLQRGIDFTL